MLCHPEPGSAVSYALRNAKSRLLTKSTTRGLVTDSSAIIL